MHLEKKYITLILKKLEKNISPEENYSLKEWLSVSNNKRVFEKIKSAWQEGEPIEFDSNLAFHKVSSKLNLIDKIEKNPKPKKVNSWFKYAASFILIAVLGISIIQLIQEDFIIHETAYNQSKEIVLPDQSSVILNANSTLRFQQKWNKREVWIEGEAYFSVQHLETNKKFTVHANKIDVEVIGTEFNVKNRRGETQVVLDKGKVEISSRALDQGILMKPGELVEVNEQKNTIQSKRVNTELFTSWKNNKLVFDDTPIRKIIELIEDNYGLSVRINDKQELNKEFTGEFPADDVSILLKALKNFEVEFEKEKATGLNDQKEPR